MAGNSQILHDFSRCRDDRVRDALPERLAVVVVELNRGALAGDGVFSTCVWQQMFFAAPQELLLGGPLPGLLYEAVWFPGNLLCALGAGAFIYYVLERPLHRWRKKLAAALTLEALAS